MKKVRSICGKALLVCMALLLLAGCGSSEEPKENPLYNTEMTGENSMEVTFVNASGYPVRELTTLDTARCILRGSIPVYVPPGGRK